VKYYDLLLPLTFDMEPVWKFLTLVATIRNRNLSDYYTQPQACWQKTDYHYTYFI